MMTGSVGMIAWMQELDNCGMLEVRGVIDDCMTRSGTCLMDNGDRAKFNMVVVVGRLTSSRTTKLHR
jgi:hypothetical protein